MKKRFSFLLILLIFGILLCGCDFGALVKDSCTVNFYVDGELYESKTVAMGSTVSMPTPPQKTNEIFVGWYVGSVFTAEFDFSTPILMDINLRAYYTVDAINTSEMIYKDAMHSVVTVINKCFNTSLGGFVQTDSATSQGSGVVIDISGGYCYVLTNAHVAEHMSDFSNQALTVEDPWGNEYEAHIYKHVNKDEKAIDEAYDLALIYFKYQPDGDMLLSEMGFSADPVIGDNVIALGSPEGQKNSVTYGNAISYQKLGAQDGEEPEVTFDVLFHDAFLTHGSSGGPLIDPEGRLVGLNFAGVGDGIYGCAIPLSKIKEFLDIYVYVE